MAQNKDFLFFLAGDVMTGRGIDHLLPCSVDPVLYERYVKNAGQYAGLAERHSGPLPQTLTYNELWGDALNELKRQCPAVKVINLETAITTRNEPWPQKGIHYRMHPENTALLTLAGIDVCVLGNNHTADWGPAGLTDTIRNLKDHDLAVAGAGTDSFSASAPAICSTGNGRVLVFSYASACSGTPREWKAEEDKPGVNFLEQADHTVAKDIIDNVGSVRKPGDRVVISIHWGSNWGYEIPSGQRTLAHQLIDAGVADIIHGHSSHHPRGIEVYKNRLILYGCGDLINDYEGISGYEQYRDDLSLMYFPKLDAGGALVSLKMIPMKLHRFSLKYAGKEERSWIAEKLSHACEMFGTMVTGSEEGPLQLHW